MINLNQYFNLIKGLNYAVTKIDVPYNPKTFPTNYAIGKDLDIFISSSDFETFKSITIDFCNIYKNIFKILIIDNNNNFRIRLLEKNKLHYQFDLTKNDIIIKNRSLYKNFYILSLDNEIIIRKEEYKKNSNKIHHKEWLLKNKVNIFY